MNRKIGIIGTVLVAMTLMSMLAVVPAWAAADPTNATASTVANETYSGASTAGSASAKGGNITEVNVGVNSQTTKWQGFYGNVSGGISLKNSGAISMYDWSGTVAGEVYATQDSAVNTSEWAALVNKTGADIDSVYFPSVSAVDNATNTFTEGSFTPFNVSGRTIATNASSSVKTLGGPGWETIALGNTTTTTKTQFVFASIIRGDSTGDAYDGTTKDFQMLVPVETGTETYYFYVELT